MIRVLLAVALLVLAGCQTPDQAQRIEAPQPSPVVALPTVETGPTAAPPAANDVPVPPADSCRVKDGLPDHACTPGLVNALTATQLCAVGFTTRTIRPPASFTNALKLRLMESYGQRHRPAQSTDLQPADVELDHLIALEDGGHPWSPRNLWPQPRKGEPNAAEKDVVETAVKQLICRDQSRLQDYQAQLAWDWRTFKKAGALAPSVTVEPTKEPEP